MASLLAVAGLHALVAPIPAAAGVHPGNPNGGPPPLATAGADPAGEIDALVRGGGAALRGGNGRSSCRWFPGSLASPVGGFLEVKPGEGFRLGDAEDGGVVLALYGRLCGGETAPTWVFVNVVSARQVANIGLDKVRDRLPKPDAMFSPDIRDSDSPAVVHLPLWFAVPDGQWQPISATATVAGLSATVKATPSGLTLAPGDGRGSVQCAGPGARWRPGAAEPVRPPACSYVYRDASTIAPNGETWSAQLAIHWNASWTATNGEGGDLGTLTTTTGYAIPVREIQGVETASAGRDR